MSFVLEFIHSRLSFERYNFMPIFKTMLQEQQEDRLKCQTLRPLSYLLFWHCSGTFLNNAPAFLLTSELGIIVEPTSKSIKPRARRQLHKPPQFSYFKTAAAWNPSILHSGPDEKPAQVPCFFWGVFSCRGIGYLVKTEGFVQQEFKSKSVKQWC